MMTTLIAIIKSLLVFYICFTAALYFLQGYLIFAPYHSTPPLLEDTPLKGLAEPIQISGKDNLNITSWMIPPDADTSPIIIFFHGNAAHALHGSARALFFKNHGYGYVLAEYRGYGGNKGRPSEYTLYNDARRLVKKIKHDYPNTPIILYGESLGTGVATQMATEFDIKALILEAPFTSVTNVAKSNYPFVPIELLLKHRFENERKIEHIEAPLLIIHGQQDRVIPFNHALNLYKIAKEPKSLMAMKDASHNDLMNHGSLNIAASFLDQL